MDPLDLLGLCRGVDQGGWDPAEKNFGLYTIVIGAQTLHATGYAMGVQRDGLVGTGDADLAPPPAAVLALQQAACDLNNSRYPFQLGLVPFREEIARFMDSRFGLEVDPMAELLADLIAKGEVAPTAARAILKLHRDLLKPKGD